MKPATRLALSIVTVLLVQVLAVAVVIAVVQVEISRSQSRWCDTLQLLTSAPVTPPADPAANPSREGQYRLYLDFVTLRKVFGCKLSGTTGLSHLRRIASET